MIEFSKSQKMQIAASPRRDRAREVSVFSSAEHSSAGKRPSIFGTMSRKVSYMSSVLNSFSAERFDMAMP